MKSAILVGMLMAAAASASAQLQPNIQTADADRVFLTRAVRDGLAEIELGRLATQKGLREEVRKYGQMMTDNHTKAVQDLKALALRRNITWPTDLDEEGKALYGRLSALRGVLFDRAYMQVVTNDHRLMADDVGVALASAGDPEIKAWAARALLTIEEHLRHAEDVTRAIYPPGSTQ